MANRARLSATETDGGFGVYARRAGGRLPEAGLTCVVGLGSDLWDRRFGEPRPAGLHPLPEIAGATHTAVATPGDLLFHIRARRLDQCFELAGRLVARLDGRAQGEGGAARAAAVIGDEDPDFAGGSYAVVQRYLHDLAAWDALPVEEQERVVGREKLSDIELADDAEPANARGRRRTRSSGSRPATTIGSWTSRRP